MPEGWSIFGHQGEADIQDFLQKVFEMQRAFLDLALRLVLLLRLQGLLGRSHAFSLQTS
jgi:hypothetical protein